MVGEKGRWESSQLRAALAFLGIVVVACASVWAVITVGSPATARMKELDDARVSDLNSIQREIEYFYEKEGKLPATLEELDIDEDYLKDPDSDESYGYLVKDPQHYQLSCRFALADKGHRGWYDHWSHEAGVQEFSFKVKEKQE